MSISQINLYFVLLANGEGSYYPYNNNENDRNYLSETYPDLWTNIVEVWTDSPMEQPSDMML